MFELHPNLEKRRLIVDLPLSKVLLEDRKHYPWVLLVPRKPGIVRMMDLSLEDQQQLMVELDFVQKAMWNEFKPKQINVAAIGNRIPQLHVHVIARYEDDPAWPGTVWDHEVRDPCDSHLVQERLDIFKRILQR